mmetsp:Transcript_52212/g.122159  ORF Transcript_52212/g.122159 Transcript_52212/m.122159 type:complete len:666 (-) Transcript_52212:58-2055(-)
MKQGWRTEHPSSGLEAVEECAPFPESAWQEFSDSLAKQLASLHASVLHLHVSDVASRWSEADKGNLAVATHWKLPPSCLSNAADNKPHARQLAEAKVLLHDSPMITGPSHGPLQKISLTEEHTEQPWTPASIKEEEEEDDAVQFDCEQTVSGRHDVDDGESCVTMQTTGTKSRNSARSKPRRVSIVSLCSNQAQPAPDQVITVGSRMPKNASRTVHRIDDLDDIVTLGYRGLQQRRRKDHHNCDEYDKSATLRKKRKKFNSLYLEPAICAVLLLNAIQIGITMDYGDWDGWPYVELTFLIIYILELVLKVFLLGLKELCGRPQLWFNLADLVIIAIALFGVVVTFSVRDDGALSNPIVIFRLARLARITRLIRLLRFDFFKELLTMVAGLFSGMRTLLWAFVLLFLAIYPMSLVLTQFIGQDESTANDAQMRELFKTVPRSMLTVFRCVTGDCNFSDGTPAVLDLIERYGIVWIPIYVAVMLIVTLGLFNLIVAIFVDTVLADAKKQERERKLHRLKDRSRQRDFTAQLLEMLLDRTMEDHILKGETIDPHEGLERITHMSVNKDSFTEFLKDPEVHLILDELDVPEEERLDIFEVLDANGNGTLQLEELIHGVIRLRGDPKRSDVIQVLLVIRSLQEEMQDFRDDMMARVHTLQLSVDTVGKDS